jgi:hypothetical protein
VPKTLKKKIPQVPARIRHRSPGFWERHGRQKDRDQEGERKKAMPVLFLFAALVVGIFLFEFFNPPGSIDQFLLSGKERMAGGTDFNPYFVHHGTEFEFVAAGTNSGDLMIGGMDIGFHGKHSLDKDGLDEE